MVRGERNVLGGDLELCSADPLTGFYRDGFCTAGPEDRGTHTICAVVTAEFLEHQRSIGNDLVRPAPGGASRLHPANVGATRWLESRKPASRSAGRPRGHPRTYPGHRAAPATPVVCR